MVNTMLWHHDCFNDVSNKLASYLLFFVDVLDVVFGNKAEENKCRITEMKNRQHNSTATDSHLDSIL